MIRRLSVLLVMTALILGLGAHTLRTVATRTLPAATSGYEAMMERSLGI